jgi:hypothetical protein
VQLVDKNQYNNKELVEVKIPMHLPYYSSWSDYERVDGQIEFNGTYYSYVKRKVTDDTLYILCLPNVVKTKLYAAQNDYSKHANDIPSEKDSGSSKKNGIFNEYNQQVSEYNFVIFTTNLNREVHHFASPLITLFIDNNFQPPEVTA